MRRPNQPRAARDPANTTPRSRARRAIAKYDSALSCEWTLMKSTPSAMSESTPALASAALRASRWGYGDVATLEIRARGDHRGPTIGRVRSPTARSSRYPNRRPCHARRLRRWQRRAAAIHVRRRSRYARACPKDRGRGISPLIHNARAGRYRDRAEFPNAYYTVGLDHHRLIGARTRSVSVDHAHVRDGNARLTDGRDGRGDDGDGSQSGDSSDTMGWTHVREDDGRRFYAREVPCLQPVVGPTPDTPGPDRSFDYRRCSFFASLRSTP